MTSSSTTRYGFSACARADIAADGYICLQPSETPPARGSQTMKVDQESDPRRATHSLYRHAKLRIPGGTQLLSKRPEMFLPDQWPSYYSKAKGVEVWDLDGNKYID